MRQPEFGGQRWRPNFHLRWTWTTALVAAYVVVLLAQKTADHFGDGDFVFKYFALSAEGLAHGYVWQLLTYQFMHGGWLHLILNCWAIIVFGSVVERMLGGRRYLTLAFASGAVGGVVQVLTAIIWPGLFGGAVVGASACAFGLVAAFAMMLPEQELTMLIFFVIPVRMRAKTLLLLSLVVALMGIIFPMGNIANAAHLGGMAMGWFYVKKIIRHPALLGVAEEQPYYRSEPVRDAGRTADDFDGGDVDAVLDKISARGINSLTTRERAILEAARKRMAQR
jgi:membrane associated rhomboid family serine protease